MFRLISRIKFFARKRFKLIVSCFLLFGVCIYFGSIHADIKEVGKVKVAILCPYNEGSVWYDRVLSKASEEISAHFGANSCQVFSVDVETSEQRSDVIEKLNKFGKCDLIIAGNDKIAKMLSASAESLGYAPRILASSVMQQDVASLVSLPNVTGIIEKKNFIETAKIAMDCFPSVSKIFVITYGDIDGTYQELLKSKLGKIQEMSSKQVVFLDSHKTPIMNILQVIRENKNDSIILLGMPEFSRRIDHAKRGESLAVISQIGKIPLFSTDDFAFQSGVVFGGAMVIAEDYAKQIAELAIVLAPTNMPLNEIPFEHQRVFHKVNYLELKALKADLSKLPSDTIYANGLKDWFGLNIYHVIVWAASLVILFLSLTIIFHLRRRSMLLKGVFESIPMKVVVVDKRGKVLFARTKETDSIRDYKNFAADIDSMPLEIRRIYKENAEKIFESRNVCEVLYEDEDSKKRIARLSYLPSEYFDKECMLLVSRDVTDLHLAMQKEAELTTRLEGTLKAITDCVFTVDASGKLTMCSDSALQMLGKTPQEITDKYCSDFFSVENFSGLGDKSLPIIDVIRKDKPLKASEYAQFVFKNGVRIPVSISISPIHDNICEIVGAVIVARDITEERQQMLVVKSSNILMKTLANFSKIGYFQLDSDFKTISIDIPNSLGIGVDAKAMNPEYLLNTQDFRRYARDLVRLRNGQIDSVNFRVASPIYSGQFFNIAVVKHKSAETDSYTYYGVCQNITELVATEKQSLDSARLLETLLDNLPCAIFIKDHSNGGKYIVVNNHYCKLMGMSKAELIGKNDYDVFDKDTANSYVSADYDVIRSGKMFTVEETIPTKDGEVHYVHTSKVGVVSEDSRQLILCICIDIGGRKKLEFELTRKTKLFECVLENVPAGIFCKNPQDNYSYVLWNKYMEDLTGMSADNVIGADNTKIDFFKDNIESFRMSDETAMLSNRPIERIEYMKSKSGKRVINKIWKMSMDVGEGHPYLLGIAVDLTQIYEAEASRAKLLTEIQSYANRETILNECLGMLMAEGDLSSIVASVLEKLGNSVDADSCCMFKFSDNCKKIALSRTWSKHAVEDPNSEIYSSFKTRGDWIEVLRMRKCVMLSDFPSTVLDHAHKLAFGGKNIQSIIISGVWNGNELWGAISQAFNVEKIFTSEEEAFMITVSNSIGLALIRRHSIELLKKSEEEKSIILDNINIPVQFFDGKGNMININNASAEFWGKTRTEIMSGPCCTTICNSPVRPGHCPIAQVLRTKQVYRREDCFPDKTFIATAIPILDENGEIKNIVETLIDTTIQTKAREEIENARVAAESSNKAKSMFLATMSHEIRTPLNAVLGLSELLLLDDTIKSEQSCMENVRSINTAGSALLSIINDVLEISKIEADKLSVVYEWINTNTLFLDMKRIFDALAQKKGLTLEFKLPESSVEIYHSESNLRQMLLNLVGNAIKFTSKGGVVVTLEVVKNEDESTFEEEFSIVRLIVKDSGRGIHKDDFDQIFNPFVQSRLNKIGSASEGTGLGLAIVSRLVEKLGGEILLESEVGIGSTFTIQFPKILTRRNKVVKDKKLEEKTLSAVAGMNIWVVDDVELNCKVLSMMLKKFNANSKYMTMTSEAFELAKNGERPDLIMTDMWMPEMNGEEFAKMIHEIMPQVPIVAVTADAEAKQNFDMKNFHGVLIKPITIEKVENLFESLTRSSKSSKSKK